MDDLEQMFLSLQRLRRAEEEHLRRLASDNPKLMDVALALTDSLVKDLIYLCHFEKVVGHDGRSWDVVEIMHRLEANIRGTFKRITGIEYVPENVRKRALAKELSS